MAAAKSLRTELHLAGAQILVKRWLSGLWHPTIAHCEAVIVLQPTVGAITAAENAVAKVALETALHWVTRWKKEHFAWTDEIKRKQVARARNSFRVAILSEIRWCKLKSAVAERDDCALGRLYNARLRLVLAQFYGKFSLGLTRRLIMQRSKRCAILSPGVSAMWVRKNQCRIRNVMRLCPSAS